MTWQEEFYELLCSSDSTPEKINKAYELKNTRLPEAIYKYLEITDEKLKTFEKNKIWLSNPANFNDPFDSLLTVDYKTILLKRTFQKLLAKAGTNPKLPVEVIENAFKSADPDSFLLDFAAEKDGADAEENKIFKENLNRWKESEINNLQKLLTENTRNGFKVCSFSERRPDDSPITLLMWAHYAKSHEGFCVEYDLSSASAKDFKYRFLYPVVYSDNLFDASKYMEEFNLGKANPLYWKKAALTKSTIWSNEVEWRLLYDAGVIPNDCEWDYLPAKVIYLGAKISTDNQNSLINIAKTNKIAVFKMKPLKDTFGLEAEQVV